MKKSRMKTVHTEYGDTEIEIVDCDSCNNTIAKEEALSFSIGNKEGWACPHCYEEGPVSFPKKIKEWSIGFGKDKNGGSFISFFTFFPFYVFFGMVLSLFDDNISEDDPELLGVGWTLWTIVFYGIGFIGFILLSKYITSLI